MTKYNVMFYLMLDFIYNNTICHDVYVRQAAITHDVNNDDNAAVLQYIGVEWGEG